MSDKDSKVKNKQMRLPCGCVVGEKRGKLMLFFLRHRLAELFDLLHLGDIKGRVQRCV